MARMTPPFAARPRAEQLEQAKQFLLATFADAPLPAAEVRAQVLQAGISLPTLQRARDALGIRAKKEGKNWVWLPAPVPTMTEVR
jgi:hypothetical protein